MRSLVALMTLVAGLQVSASDLEHESYALVGQALVEIGPFGLDVYQARFFKGRPDEILIELTYLRDVPRYLSLKGWEKGFSHIEPGRDNQAAIDWIHSNTPNFEEGDRFAMLVTGSATRLFLNGRLLSESRSENVGKIIHVPWIGDRALDHDVRAKLLGRGQSGETVD
jgi:hypothetical protein